MSSLKSFNYKLFILLILSNFNLFALDIIKITSIDFKENENVLKTAGKGGDFKTRADGAFIYERAGNPYPWSIVVKPDKSYFSYIPLLYNNTYTTNILSTTNINKINYDIVEVTENQNESSINSNIILATISEKGYISCETKTIGTNKYIFRMTKATNQPPQTLISANYIRKSELVIIKFNSNGEKTTEQKLENINLVESNLKSFVNDPIFRSKFVIFCQITDSNFIFYRLTDPDLLSSPNRITLGSNQNGSITATVNNPEQALLNIQSSTNLIDWNTFKTIQNEPTLEIVVPANQPKEFLRVKE